MAPRYQPGVENKVSNEPRQTKVQSATNLEQRLTVVKTAMEQLPGAADNAKLRQLHVQLFALRWLR